MRKIGLFFTLLLVGSASVVFPCTTECPDGYLAVCVKHQGECRCDCARDASEGVNRLRALLRNANMSKASIEEVVRRYRGYVDNGINNFSFRVERVEVFGRESDTTEEIVVLSADTRTEDIEPSALVRGTRCGESIRRRDVLMLEIGEKPLISAESKMVIDKNVADLKIGNELPETIETGRHNPLKRIKRTAARRGCNVVLLVRAWAEEEDGRQSGTETSSSGELGGGTRSYASVILGTGEHRGATANQSLEPDG